MYVAVRNLTSLLKVKYLADCDLRKMSNKRVVVIGAGVTGLTTANLLLQQEKGFKVHLVAKHFPGDLSGEYTSPWAGAHWRSQAADDDTRMQEYERETFHYFWELSKKTQDKTGIMIIDEFGYQKGSSQELSNPWFKTLCPEFRHLKNEELPTGIEFGITYKTISINPTTYIGYLLDTFTSLGGTTQRVSLSHLNECIESDTDIVINCSGIHARTLGGVEDLQVYAARGQTVIVQLQKPYTDRAFYVYMTNKKPGSTELTYAIPRDNGEVVLGGTYDEHKYSTDVDNDVAEGIIQRCLATGLLPKEVTVKGHGVGLRPCRKGGIRVDAEWTTSEKLGKEILICHNYGHGGAGFQSSYGAARHMIKIMNEMLAGH